MRKIGTFPRDQNKSALMLVCTDGDDSSGDDGQSVMDARKELKNDGWIIYAVGALSSRARVHVCISFSEQHKILHKSILLFVFCYATKGFTLFRIGAVGN